MINTDKHGFDIGPQAKSDSVFTAKYRLLQSEYRAKVLKEAYGAGPNKNSKTKYGNMLVNGEESGSNFISDAAFEYAKSKVEKKKTVTALTIDEFRLFNNMLSSMPMCFNLFSDLRDILKSDPAVASTIARSLFPELSWIMDLIEVHVEYIPMPIADYTNDKSAFDAMLIIRDENGDTGLIAIETKYTDILGANVAHDSETKNRLIEQGGFCSEELNNELKTKGYQQIHRNFLLTYAYAAKNNMSHFVNIVISPAEDKISVKEIGEMRKGMTRYQDCIFKIPLETIVQRGCDQSNKRFSTVMKRFKDRYIA